MNSQWILIICFFVQIHLKKSNFIFVTRLQRNDRRAAFLSHVCSGFNIFFWPHRLRSFIYRKVRAISFPQNRFSSYIKTYYKTPVAFKVLTKHMVRLQRRCFFILYFFLTFSKSACGCGAVKNFMFTKKHRFR